MPNYNIDENMKMKATLPQNILDLLPFQSSPQLMKSSVANREKPTFGWKICNDRQMRLHVRRESQSDSCVKLSRAVPRTRRRCYDMHSPQVSCTSGPSAGLTCCRTGHCLASCVILQKLHQPMRVLVDLLDGCKYERTDILKNILRKIKKLKTGRKTPKVMKMARTKQNVRYGAAYVSSHKSI